MAKRTFIKDQRQRYEIDAVKQLGEQIGYGNMMTIAAALWRRMLKESGVPESGAFAICSSHSLQDEDLELHLKDCAKYNAILTEIYGPSKINKNEHPDQKIP